jgi:hypothetical protein
MAKVNVLKADRPKLKVSWLLELADFLQGKGKYEGKGVPREKFDINTWMMDSNFSDNRRARRTRVAGKEAFRKTGKTVVAKVPRADEPSLLVKMVNEVQPNHCQTAGCACGWAATLPSFRRRGLALVKLPDAYMPRIYFDGLTDFDAVQKFFGLKNSEAEFLFSGGKYIQELDKITPSIVARRIRKFVAAAQKSPDTRAHIFNEQGR